MNSRHNKRQPIDANKQAVIDLYRKGALEVLKSIRQGLVNEVELDKLQNFVQTGLTIMELVPLETFRRAQRLAEMRSLIHHHPEEQVIMAPCTSVQTMVADELDAQISTSIQPALDEIFTSGGKS